MVCQLVFSAGHLCFNFHSSERKSLFTSCSSCQIVSFTLITQTANYIKSCFFLNSARHCEAENALFVLEDLFYFLKVPADPI